MTQIKTYRVELNKVGDLHEVRIYGRMGEVVNNIQPAERLFRQLSSSEEDVEKWEVHVHDFIQRLVDAGFDEV